MNERAKKILATVCESRKGFESMRAIADFGERLGMNAGKDDEVAVREMTAVLDALPDSEIPSLLADIVHVHQGLKLLAPLLVLEFAKRGQLTAADMAALFADKSDELDAVRSALESFKGKEEVAA